MNIKIFGRNISAVSLIEIMMIFTIIGVVTTACVSLAKPKHEYMKKIKVYAAFDMLENAAKIIQNEGSIDYTTDANVCKSRNAHYLNCQDYKDQYPNLSNQLPKATNRGGQTYDPNYSVSNYTIYKHLGKTEREQYSNLQKGICERLQAVINTQGYKNLSCNTSYLIEDSNPSNVIVPGYFKNKTAQLILPNGNALYISKHLYTDFGQSRYQVYATSNDTYRSDVENCIATNCASISGYVPGLLNGKNSLTQLPNETRLAGANTYNNQNAINLYSRNKDYFVIYVDTNCQMTSYNIQDKMCGSDTLNDDVFAFRMYRDGTVIPDPSTNFPPNMLTARVLVQDTTNNEGKYSVNINYSNIPLNKARCYANLMCNGVNNNSVCSICNNYADVKTPLSDCVLNNGDTKCKVIINKPSFIMR